MQNTKSTVETKTVYKPVAFLSGTFLITWLCAGLMTFTDYNADPVVFTVLDFLENASPLICALFLLKTSLSPLPALKHFLFGKTGHLSFYLIVAALSRLSSPSLRDSYSSAADWRKRAGAVTCCPVF